MPKSIRNENNIPTEHSWRGYAPFYTNLFYLLKEIPLNVVEHLNEYTIEEVETHNTSSDL